MADSNNMGNKVKKLVKKSGMKSPINPVIKCFLNYQAKFGIYCFEMSFHTSSV